MVKICPKEGERWSHLEGHFWNSDPSHLSKEIQVSVQESNVEGSIQQEFGISILQERASQGDSGVWCCYLEFKHKLEPTNANTN